MRIVCWQTILMKYHPLFLSEIRKDVAKFVVCCSCDWRFKGYYKSTSRIQLDKCTENANNGYQLLTRENRAIHRDQTDYCQQRT